MLDKRKVGIMAGMLALIGADFTSGPDSTAYRPEKQKPKPTGRTTKRANVKAARKQRRKAQ